jgi:hypothetical protein
MIARSKGSIVDAAQQLLSGIGSDDQRDFVNALLAVPRVMTRANLELHSQLHQNRNGSQKQSILAGLDPEE